MAVSEKKKKVVACADNYFSCINRRVINIDSRISPGSVYLFSILKSEEYLKGDHSDRLFNK